MLWLFQSAYPDSLCAVLHQALLPHNPHIPFCPVSSIKVHASVYMVRSGVIRPSVPGTFPAFPGSFVHAHVLCTLPHSQRTAYPDTYTVSLPSLHPTFLQMRNAALLPAEYPVSDYPEPSDNPEVHLPPVSENTLHWFPHKQGYLHGSTLL